MRSPMPALAAEPVRGTARRAALCRDSRSGFKKNTVCTAEAAMRTVRRARSEGSEARQRTERRSAKNVSSWRKAGKNVSAWRMKDAERRIVSKSEI